MMGEKGAKVCSVCKLNRKKKGCVQEDAGWRKVVGVCVFFVCQCMKSL